MAQESVWILLGTRFLITNIGSAGIFMVSTRVLEYCCMNMGLSLCFRALCALLSLTTTLCLVKIGSTFPCSGVHYYFLKRCFSSCISFLYLWTSLFLFLADCHQPDSTLG